MQNQKTEVEASEMVTVATSRFGEVEVSSSQVILFPRGVLGFPTHNRFVLLAHKADSPFSWFQSADDPDLAFIVMNPQMVVADYVVDLAKEDQRDLQLKGEESMVIYGLVTIPRGNPAEMTINLQGPLVINATAGVGKQVIINGSSYSHRQPVLCSGSESNPSPHIS